MRTTLNIDAPVLEELKRLGQAAHVPLGRLASELLAKAIRETTANPAPRASFAWIGKPMGARVDIADRDALYAAMDSELQP